MSPVVLKSQLIFFVPHSGERHLLVTKIFYELPRKDFGFYVSPILVLALHFQTENYLEP